MRREEQPLIFEISKPGRIGYSLPELDVPEVLLMNWCRSNICANKNLNCRKFPSVTLFSIIQLCREEIMALIPAFIRSAPAR